MMHQHVSSNSVTSNVAKNPSIFHESLYEVIKVPGFIENSPTIPFSSKPAPNSTPLAWAALNSIGRSILASV